MYSLIPILKEAAEQDAIFTVGKIETVGGELLNTKKFYPCDYKTYWLRPCMKVEFPSEAGGIAFGEVVEVQNNEWVIIKFDRDIDLDGKEFVIHHGTFIHGTLPMADMEINEKEIGLMGGKFPMPIIYFQELFTETKLPLENANDFIGENLRIYFLDDYHQNTAWLTEDHYENIVYPMKNYAYFLLDNLKKDLRIDYQYLDDNSQRIIGRVKTGDYKSGKNEASVFTRNLSGAELVASVAVKEDIRCGGC